MTDRLQQEVVEPGENRIPDVIVDALERAQRDFATSGRPDAVVKAYMEQRLVLHLCFGTVLNEPRNYSDKTKSRNTRKPLRDSCSRSGPGVTLDA